MKKQSSQKAAMFGLDARLALAIYASLTLISIAFFFKIIDEVKTFSLNQDLLEISKSLESYTVDTGAFLKSVEGSSEEEFAYKKASDLIDSTLRGAKSRYTPYKNEKTVSKDVLIHPKYGEISFMGLRKSQNWGSGNLNSGWCIENSPCGIWAKISNLKKDRLISLDRKVDSSVSADSGKVRYNEATGDLFYFLQITPGKFTDALKYNSWNVGSWGGCNLTSGNQGTQTRSVTCSEEPCKVALKPTTIQNCTVPYKNWSTSSWGACSKKCNSGTQTRSITCSSAPCDESNKPATSQTCNTHSCPSPSVTCNSGTLQDGKCVSCTYSSACNQVYNESYDVCVWKCHPGSCSGFFRGKHRDTTYPYGKKREEYEICQYLEISYTCPSGYTYSGGSCI